MLREKIFIIILILLSGYGLSGQTAAGPTKISLAYPVYSQYLHNGLIINPAYAGSREVLSVFSSARFQWMGVEGAPRFQSISIHSLLKNDKIGLGLSGQFFQFGYTKATSVYTDYAYHLRVGKSKLSMGLTAGFDMSNTNYAGILETLTDPGDPVFASNDKPYILPNVGAGLYFYNKKFFIGAAVPAFLSYVKSSVGKVSFKTFTDFDVVATAGALITFSDGLKFKPSVFVDYSMQKTKKMRIDLNGNFIIKDFLWIGGSWRTSEKVAVGILQFQISPQAMVGFSYDYPVGTFSPNWKGGSSEVVFRYEFGYKVTADNPRYF
jgi:type IX secretion system PorP/SprF family membrane protein